MSWCKLQIHAVGGHSDFMWVYTRLSSKTRSTHRNSHIIAIKQLYISYIFKIYKKHLFSCYKTETLKITVFAFFKQRKLTIKLHLSESLTFQNHLKNRKLLPAKKFGNILDFEKESKTKLISRQFY